MVFLSDQDDSWHPDKLARHEAIYEANPDVGLVFSDANVVDSQLQPLGLRMSQQLGVTPERLAQLSGPGLCTCSFAGPSCSAARSRSGRRSAAS